MDSYNYKLESGGQCGNHLTKIGGIYSHEHWESVIN